MRLHSQGEDVLKETHYFATRRSQSEGGRRTDGFLQVLQAEATR